MGKPKSRGNGQGTAYKRGKTWEACVVVGWKKSEDKTKPNIPIKRRKSGFPTKASALAYCVSMRKEEHPKRTFSQVYEEWVDKYSARVGESAMNVYKAAFKHYSKLHEAQIASITAKDLQDCMDACTRGKRTHETMKSVARLIWAYSFDSDYVQKDVTANLYTGKGKIKQREPLTDEEVEAIRQAIPSEPYAEYIYALCYLGFRPGEFLKLKKTDLHEEGGVTYLVGGGKTEAGTNRRVPVPSPIAGIIQHRMSVGGTDLLFPRIDQKGAVQRFLQMSDEFFRESVFKPLMYRLGIAEGKVPYCARHTYSDKLKVAAGDDKAKAALMGHTDYNFTRSHYQSVDIQDIKIIADSIK